jgi:glycosyltransferase involved in cell wall biosynthesis
MDHREGSGRLNLPFVSIIVIVYNMKDTIEQCLASLMTLNYPPDRREVVVVDGGSTDGTQELARQFRVKLVVEGQPGRGYARNAGIDHAKGDIVAFIDADCVAAKDWLLHHVPHYANPRIGAVGGSITNPNLDATGIYTVVNHYVNFAEFDERAARRYMYHIPTCNASYRKTAVEEVGGFEETAHRYEDYILSQQLIKKGYQIVFDPLAKVYHLERAISARDFLRSERANGVWHNRAQRLCKDMFGRLPAHKAVALLLLPSIILARWVREIYKLRHVFRYAGLSLIPLLLVGGSVWSCSYVKEALTSEWQGEGELAR